MLVLGLQGSPRLKGNTRFLLESFLERAREMGARTRMLDVDRMNIVPCKEYITCEKKGFCPIDDDMKSEIYGLLREAELVVAASPIFFFNMTAQLKALVDRCQLFWARKYRFRLKDPLHKQRAGFVIGVGASKAPKLFDGLELTAKYFFDALDADFKGRLTYKNVEDPSDIRQHPTALQDVEQAVKELLSPFLVRKKVLFTCPDNACLSQMAGAFAQSLAGDRLDVSSAGFDPAEATVKNMAVCMEELKIDMKFRGPKSIEDAVSDWTPEIVVAMGEVTKEKVSDRFPDVEIVSWNDVQRPEDDSLESARTVREQIENRVARFVENH